MATDIPVKSMRIRRIRSLPETTSLRNTDMIPVDTDEGTRKTSLETITSVVKNSVGTVVGQRGERGATGPQGPMGPAGINGKDGDRGSQGPIGLQGPKGNDGTAGKDGETGLQGPAGDKGETGERGLQGIQGPKGDTGSTGSTGTTGAKGDTGAKGETGPKGDTGSQGPQGIAGSKGDPGDSRIKFAGTVSTNSSGVYTKVFAAGLFTNSPVINISPQMAAASGQYVWSHQITGTAATGFTVTVTFGKLKSGISVAVLGINVSLLETNSGVVMFSIEASEPTI